MYHEHCMRDVCVRVHVQVLNLEASLSAVHSERSQSDTGLKSRMQELLSELQSTLQVRVQLAR